MPRRSLRPCGHCDAIDFGAGGGIPDYQITNGYVNFRWTEPIRIQ
jgi:hypothetical protein